MPLSGSFPSGTPGRSMWSVAAFATPSTPRVPWTEPTEMPDQGTAARRHVAGNWNRKPCGAWRRPVRCDDTEPATRHDRQPTLRQATPDARPRPPQGRASPMPARPNGRVAAPIVNRAGAPPVRPSDREAPSSRHEMRSRGQDPFHRVRRRGLSRTASGAQPTDMRGPRHAFCPDGRQLLLGDSPRRVPARAPRNRVGHAPRAPPWRPQARPSKRYACHVRASPERLR
jgi:hypothetical protein